MTNAGIKLPEGEEQIDMCLAIEQIKEESMAKGILRGREEGILRGREEGTISLLAKLVHGGLLTFAEAAKQAQMTEEQLKAKMNEAGYVFA